MPRDRGWPYPLTPIGGYRPHRCAECGKVRFCALVFLVDEAEAGSVLAGSFIDLCGNCLIADGCWSRVEGVTFVDET